MITLNDLSIGYDKPLMEPLSHTFEDGKIYGVLGKSGCGKSTLLKTIAGMQRPLSGTVERGDAHKIYMMHQRYTNFDWLDCVENVLIAERDRRKRKERVKEAEAILRDVGLGEYLDRYPRELSGGMQQRLALARVLFVKPYYLLMDEPLSALDNATRTRMQSLIKEVHKNTHGTIIMVTHSEKEAETMCDEIIKLHKQEDT